MKSPIEGRKEYHRINKGKAGRTNQKYQNNPNKMLLCFLSSLRKTYSITRLATVISIMEFIRIPRRFCGWKANPGIATTNGYMKKFARLCKNEELARFGEEKMSIPRTKCRKVISSRTIAMVKKKYLCQIFLSLTSTKEREKARNGARMVLSFERKDNVNHSRERKKRNLVLQNSKQ
jgi:hypothetical protein